MNDKRRSMLRSAVEYLDTAYHIIVEVLNDEEESLDNIPENLEGSEMYGKIEDTCVELSDACDYLTYLEDTLRNM